MDCFLKPQLGLFDHFLKNVSLRCLGYKCVQTRLSTPALIARIPKMLFVIFGFLSSEECLFECFVVVFFNLISVHLTLLLFNAF